ncbi:rho GTPase-activating protein 21 isoform X2 [Scaptodrosophila lebanonensis]|uniref:Rho GTPase-activating protein 21 isoform X2 n=1 Tax=Drosophila lebanonensis TaxID=7225 RepID=A0A6J2TWQ0_DROLE|nr:rho GTPase-activating protein 21 isoform X2 [Scaptodrosophila lebanonensis]
MLQNSNAAATASASAATTTTTTAATAAAAAAAANNAAIAASSIQPKLVVIRRRPNQGFGFTLRHFIAYPPEDDVASWPQEARVIGSGSNSASSSSGGGGGEATSPTSLPQYQVKAMETIFIKEVQANGPAHYANLQTGDRVLMVNNTPIAGIAYSTIVSMIKQTPTVLTLHVVPKECDVLQMHYTSIAHTPESNRLPMMTTTAAAAVAAASTVVAAATVCPQAPSPAISNGASTIKSFPQQQLISYPAVATSASLSSSLSQATHAPPLHGGSRSGSITSNVSASGSGNMQRHPALSGGSSSIDFGDMEHRLRQHQHQQQLMLYQQQQHGNLLAMQRSVDAGFMRGNQPPNLTVLPGTTVAGGTATGIVLPLPNARQPKSAAALSHALYVAAAGNNGGNGGNGGDNSDLMIRLRESIKQKEEFLKSPLPTPSNGNATQSAAQQQQQHFFPSHTPPPAGSIAAGAVSAASGGGARLPPQQIRHNVLIHKQQQQQQPQLQQLQQQQQQQQPVAVGCDMYNCYAGSKIGMRTTSSQSQSAQQQQQQQQQRQVAVNVANNNAKYVKDLDYFETLQETGVTNKVFERKLVSHMSKGFDPFKPLSINTSALDSSGMLVKKPGVLYDSLQHHPLHQMQQQQHQTKYQQHGGSSTVDGQTSSRMEVHKATVANATIEPMLNKFAAVSPPDQKQSLHPSSSSLHTVAKLADIAESSAAAIVAASEIATGGTVVRRYKPLASASFDESKPMRRISYLRATNNEIDYHGESSAAIAGSAAVPLGDKQFVTVESHKSSKALVEEHPDPTYDIVGGAGHEFIETPNGLEDVRLSSLGAACAAPGSRRASMNSDMRGSIHIDAELNGKYVPNELEAFETEIEIKSSCINGKRMSEFRSWRQVKLEIKGDLLRICSGRHGKSEHNVIELDIRNFKFYDESVDKKKYVFRMQSKPNAQLATLGNELSLEDAHEKLTNSSGSSSIEHQPQHTPVGPYTEILFKTKSSNEMKRLFGLLQWKNSLNYEDNEPTTQTSGKQLAEPQKTAATSSYLDDVSSSGPAAVVADSSPLSSHSGGTEAHASSIAADSISPVMKTRKSSSHKHVPDKDLGSPKSKNWKDLLFRRGGDGGRSSGGSGNGLSAHDLGSPSACSAKSYGSIGVPLRACPMSKLNAFVPHLVEVCTNIVETKGLGVVGIYRIPGNKAAISELSELVNTKDFQFESCATDERWDDVNVVSSLLKLFIRSLPDALMPASFYINFIEADKKTGMTRIVVLKDIVDTLPRHPYETMKHLIRHLCRVSDNCEVNRMEPKNLAIIFGPSIIRTPNDTLETAVKDMKHQCRIVELLVTQYDYFFENGNIPDLSELSGNAAGGTEASGGAGLNATLQQTQEDQTSMLLHNLSKIERFTERETRTSRFIPQLRRRAPGKRSAVSSDTYSGESVGSLDYTKVPASSTTSTSSSSTAQSHSSSCKTTSSTKTLAVASSLSTTRTTSSNSNEGSVKKRSPGFPSSRGSQSRKSSLDEKDSGSVDSTGSMAKEPQQQRSSVDISILLTDDDSSSRLSDTGSMSLTTITDTLDSKLRNLRSGSESNDENGSPEFPKNRRHTLGQPLHLHSENIPYADESPERLFHNFCPLDAPHSLILSRSCTATNTIGNAVNSKSSEKELKQAVAAVVALPSSLVKAHKLQHSATVPMHHPQSQATTPGSAAATSTAAAKGTATTNTSSTAASPVSSGSTTVAGTPTGAASSSQRSLYTSKNLRYTSSMAYAERSCAASEDDSEGSTTSDPKEKLMPASPSVFLERYNKKRRDHRLFRSASFNCRNYSTRHMNGGGGNNALASTSASASTGGPTTALTKDEKTDMNLTKKRQIQNKQNRSIKRRHTVGGPHDYSANTSGHELAAINYNHHNRHHQQQLLKLGSSAGAAAAETTTTTTTTTTVLRRMPSSGSAAAAPTDNATGSPNSSSSSNTGNNNNSPQSDGSNGNSCSSASSSSSTSSAVVGGGGGGGAIVTPPGGNAAGSAGSGDHVLEVGIRIKNINRARY